MNTYAITLFSEMELELEDVHVMQEDPLAYSELAIGVVTDKMRRLREHFMENKFAQKKDEIEFFKSLKPRFASRLVYYNEIFNIETGRPAIAGKPLRRYYRLELEKIEQFFGENMEFYRYCRAGCSHLDKKYFLRGRHDISLAKGSSCFQSDPDFSTSHDFKVARILASESIRVYLQQELQKMSGFQAELMVSVKGM